MIVRSLFIIISTAAISLLSLSLLTGPMAFTWNPDSASEVKVVDSVSVCKTNVLKYTQLGAYPEGYNQVKAALAYCNSLA
ncbi:MAG TPA: hypothetical protein VIX38_00910 [Nitrososphaeraceae archaeon]